MVVRLVLFDKNLSEDSFLNELFLDLGLLFSELLVGIDKLFYDSLNETSILPVSDLVVIKEFLDSEGFVYRSSGSKALIMLVDLKELKIINKSLKKLGVV